MSKRRRSAGSVQRPIPATAHELSALMPKDLDLRLTDEQLEKLVQYLDLLSFWNTRLNLVGPGDPRKIFKNLVLDSFYLANFIESIFISPPTHCWDPGAGAGLPGIPLRIIWNKGSYAMIEARAKRALFLKTAVARIDLPAVQVFEGRIEDFLKKKDSLLGLTEAEKKTASAPAQRPI